MTAPCFDNLPEFTVTVSYTVDGTDTFSVRNVRETNPMSAAISEHCRVNIAMCGDATITSVTSVQRPDFSVTPLSLVGSLAFYETYGDNPTRQHLEYNGTAWVDTDRTFV